MIFLCLHSNSVTVGILAAVVLRTTDATTTACMGAAAVAAEEP